MFRSISLVLLVALALSTAVAQGQVAEEFMGVSLSMNEAAQPPVLPDGYFIENAAPGASFVIPTAIAFAPDGRIFVAEKRGMVWVIENGQKLEQPFIDLTHEVMSHHDRGLLGLTLHPDFDENGYVYLLYVVDHDGTGTYDRNDAFSRLTRYSASTANPNVADLGSRHILIGQTFSDGIPACYNSHVIGTVLFGADGNLLVGSGDAASYNYVDAGGTYPDCFGEDRIDPNEDIGAFRAQYLGSMAGKILRIDPETGGGRPGNPFYTGDPFDNESRVWMLGLRNPFRFSVGTDGIPDPEIAWPGTVYVGDVGWYSWEDLHVGYGGENFGWPCFEGPETNPYYQEATPAHSGCGTVDPSDVTAPTYYWNHGNPDHSVPPGLRGSTIVAGDIYQGSRYPAELHGRLFYADYSQGWMAHTGTSGPGGLSSNHSVFSTTTGAVVDLRYDPHSELMHFVNIMQGGVFRLRHVEDGWSDAPIAHVSATPTQGPAPLEVHFTGSDSFDPSGGELTFAWDFGDGGTSTDPNPVHVYHQEGSFQAVLTVQNPAGATSTAQVAINVAELTPEAVILSPLPATLAAPGDVIALAADTEMGGLTYQWNVVQYHNDHQHPDVFTATGPEAQFTVPAHGVAHEVVYYRIRLTATDANGLSASADRHVMVRTPRHHDVTQAGDPIALVMNPTGLGNPNIEVIRNGITPPVGSADPMLQYDTDTNATGRVEDWIGYEFEREWRFSHITFQEGMVRDEGGFFEDLTVQIRRNGVWSQPDYVSIVEPYAGESGEHFSTYAIAFTATRGDAIRLIGTPGGSRTFISAAELRVLALLPNGDLPGPWAYTDFGYLPNSPTHGYGDGAFALSSGGDIWGNSDHFRFIYQPLEGDGTITARLHTVDAPNTWAKAGIMVRGALDAGAAHASFWVTPGEGRHLQVRAEADGSTDSPVGAPGGAPAWLRLDRSGDIVTAYQSLDGVTWEEFGSTTLEIGEAVYVGIAVTATDYVGGSDIAVATFSDVEVVIDDSEPPPPGQLPDGWLSEDIGFVHVAGSATYTEGTFTVTGAGDVWGDADNLHYAYTNLVGDGTISVRVDGLEAEHEWAKAGLMVRASTEPSSAHVSLFKTPGHGVHLQYRSEFGAYMTSPFGRPADEPVWLRLQRSGNVVRAYTSETGSTWTFLGSVEADLPETVLLGLAATATDHEGREDVATLTASNLSIDSGTPTPEPGALPEPWESADVGPVPVAGDASYTDGVFTVVGAGDAWGYDDRLRMVYQPIEGSVTITGEALSVDGARPWAKGGLTIRASLASNAAHASLWATPERGVSFQYRRDSSAPTDVAGSLAVDTPVWLQLRRDENLIAAFVSEDGVDWTHVGTIGIDLPAEPLVGMGITPTDYEGRGDTATLAVGSVAIESGADNLPAHTEASGQLAFAVDAIYPNPMQGRGTVALTAGQPGEYRVELFDILGRRVWNYETREEGAGNIELSLDFGPLPSGTYIFRALSPAGDAVIRRITVVR